MKFITLNQFVYEKVCTMCGELRAIKLLNEYLNENERLSNLL